MKEFLCILLCIGLVLFLPMHSDSTPKASRSIEFWSLKKLEDSADVVVIGKLTKSTSYSGTVPYDLRGAVTGELLGFDILYKLKGSPEDTVAVINWKPNKSELASYFPNLFVIDKSLDMYNDLKYKLTDSSGKRFDSNAYMIFLKRDSNNIFTPVTGSLDAKHSYIDLWLPSEK